ncbi:MAG: PHP domain-containing protein, partial [Opitutaceae bacterium]
MSSHATLFAAVLVLSSAAAAESPTAAPRWFKGNLHTHSLWSDGNDYPEMIADSYKRAGYHFLAMSDHNVLAEGARWLELKAPAAVKGEVV